MQHLVYELRRKPIRRSSNKPNSRKFAVTKSTRMAPTKYGWEPEEPCPGPIRPAVATFVARIRYELLRVDTHRTSENFSKDKHLRGVLVHRAFIAGWL
jgi:hypothetical protein